MFMVTHEEMAEEVEKRLAFRNLKGFLKERVAGPLKSRHDFKVSISELILAGRLRRGRTRRRRPTTLFEPFIHLV